KPSLRVTIEGNSRRETLLLGNPFTKENNFKSDPLAPATLHYARMEDRTQVFVTAIPNALLDTLRRAQEKLRDTKVLDFDPAAVTNISLTAPGQAEPLVLRLDEAAGWRIVRPAGAPEIPADAKLVSNLLQRLALLTVTPHTPEASGFLRDAPSDAEIENYGFNLPQREITLTLKSGTTTPATAAAPARIALQLGMSSVNGGTVQARVVGQSFIYAVAGDTLHDFPVSPNVYRERTLRTLPEGSKITGLSLVANATPDKPIVSLKLDANQTWDAALANETELRRDAIKAVLANLSTLRAKEFVRDTFSETTVVDGQPKPWTYTLSATLSLGGAESQPTTTTLQIAERSGGGTQLAGSKEFNLVFALDQPLLDALWTLTYGDRDPGAPAQTAEKPAAAP
ncbi:MAG: DUF4340 domain-containing protein, partial [Rariglobus sp.]